MSSLDRLLAAQSAVKSRSWERKLSEPALRQILAMKGGHISAASIAQYYGVSTHTVQTVWRSDLRYHRGAKEERSRIGPVEYAKLYYDVIVGEAIEEVDRQRRAVQQYSDKSINRYAVGQRGEHEWPWRDKTLRMRIHWQEDGDAGPGKPKGWYYEALGHTAIWCMYNPGEKFGPYHTSRAAYDEGRLQLQMEYDQNTDKGTVL